MADSCKADITKIRDYEKLQSRKSVEHKYVTTKTEKKTCDLKSMTVTYGSKDKNKTMENLNVADLTQSEDYDDCKIELTDEYAYTLPNENVTDTFQNEDRNETTGNELKQQERQAGITKCLYIVFLVILSDIIVCGATIGIEYYFGHYLPNREDVSLHMHITEENFTHREAKTHCSMVGIEHGVVPNLSSLYRPDLVWIDASVKYTQWAEYNDTFVFKDALKLDIKETNAEDLLLWCLEHCNRSYFGLQNDKCACSKISPTDEGFINNINSLGNTEPCSNGQAVCGIKRESGYAMYHRVDVHDLTGIGNCLTYQRNAVTAGFFVRPCSNKYKFICRTENGYYTGFKIADHWTSVHKACFPLSTPVSYSQLIENPPPIEIDAFTRSNFSFKDEVWLGNIRSYKTVSPSDPNAKYCLAAEFHDDGTVSRVVRECTDRLPALCQSG